jgi:flavorubredoxin
MPAQLPMVPESKAFRHCVFGWAAGSLVIMTRRVLVAYTSRMSSTKEIIEAIGAELSASDLDVDVLTCSSDPQPDGYDAVIIGSASASDDGTSLQCRV